MKTLSSAATPEGSTDPHPLAASLASDLTPEPLMSEKNKSLASIAVDAAQKNATREQTAQVKVTRSKATSIEQFASMSFSRRTSVDTVECPNCGKHTIVERSSNIFDCLNCSFHREFPPVGSRSVRYRSATPSPLEPLSSIAQRAAIATSQPPTLAQRDRLNALLASNGIRSALDHLPTEIGEDIIEPDKSQPWLFAFIAVVFGILLL